MSVIGFIFSVIVLKRVLTAPKVEMIEGLSVSSWQDPIVEAVKDLKTDIVDLRIAQSKTILEQAKVDMSLMKSIQELPVKTLNTIQGSANTTTGKLGELIKFIELQRAYDRIFPVGDIIDFIGIRFPNGDDKGAIDLIEIKTGDKAVLNTDQKKLRDMIASSKDTINFKVVKVEIT
jgi:predicted Holliday junction resolvase-like endonuclease